MNYTKGKWGASHPLNDKTTIITPEKLLANIEWGASIPIEEQRANGALFASAPTLYEALKECVAYFREEIVTRYMADGTIPYFEGYKKGVLALALAEKEG